MGRFIPTDTLSQKLLVEVLTEMVRFDLEGQNGRAPTNKLSKSKSVKQRNHLRNNKVKRSHAPSYRKNIKSSRQQIHL